MLDTVVIGGEPAALQIAHELDHAGDRVVMLHPGSLGEAEPVPSANPGDRVEAQERSLRWDRWSLLSAGPPVRCVVPTDGEPSPSEYARYLAAYARMLDVPVIEASACKRAERTDGGWTAWAADGSRYEARRLVLASAADGSTPPDGIPEDPEQDGSWELLEAPGVFVAGDAMAHRALDPTTRGRPCSYRYQVRALSRILRQASSQAPWPSDPLDNTVERIAQAVVRTASVSSALWHQPGAMAEAFAARHGQRAARQLHDVPVHLAEPLVPPHDVALILTLEVATGVSGERERPLDEETAGLRTFLEPIVRLYRAGGQVAEHRVIAGAADRWDDEDTQVRPLRRFLDRHWAN